MDAPAAEPPVFEYSDIGPKTLSYLAEGLYPDARDPIREYIQNGVDAGADTVALTVKNDSIIIENDGNGMSRDDLQKLLRLSISDKDPKANVGHKGIGVYSGLQIADTLLIESKQDGRFSSLKLDLARIRKLAEEKVELPDVINTCTRIDSIDSVEFENNNIKGDGTKVTLTGIRLGASKVLTESHLSPYLQLSLPLSFDPTFVFGKKIQGKIDEVCQRESSSFNAITLYLKINDRKEKKLHRPYKVTDSEQVFDPVFQEVRVPVGEKNETFAFIWSCLNKETRVFDKSEGVGFRLKQRGFTIGDEETANKFFSGGKKLAHRYIGEIILLSPYLKTNSARSEIALTEYSESFKAYLEVEAKELVAKATLHQETTKAMELVSSAQATIREAMASPTYMSLGDLKQLLLDLQKRQKKKVEDAAKESIRVTIKAVVALISEIQIKLEAPATDGSEGAPLRNSLPSPFSESQSNSVDQPVKEPIVESSGQNVVEDGPSGQESLGESSENQNLKSSSNGIPQNIEVESILRALNESGRHSPPVARKLQQLYGSMRTLAIRKHPTLGYIGGWALWEVLGKAACNDPEGDAWAFLKNELRSRYKHSARRGKQYKDLLNAINDIQLYGDTNKHSIDSFADAGQTRLYNHMEVLGSFFTDMMKLVYFNLEGVKWGEPVSV